MPTQTPSARSARSMFRVHVSGVTLAAILAHAAGTTVAHAQTGGRGPARSGAPAKTTGDVHQPSMRSAVEAATETPAAPRVGVPRNAGHTGQRAGEEGAKVRIDDNNIVDLHLSDEDLSAVLEMLSIQSQRNIVASKNVQARVTANLYGVTFYEALDAILNVNGYGYIEDGNFIYVYTLEEIAQIEKFNKQRVSKAISLNYLSSVDAAEFVKPLLSEGGQIKTNGKMASFPSMGDVPMGNEEYALAATLVIYDYEENVVEIEALIRQIDTRPAQVLIEATILQTQLNEANAFGVDFAVVADMNFTDWLPLGGPLFGPNALQLGKAGSDAVPTDGGGTALNSTVGGTQGPGGMKIGIVSNDVAVFLRVLDEVTDSTVLSNPKLLCLNRQAARVLVGRKVGYLSTTSTDTATTQTVEFLDTGTQLYVRPIVAPDGMIRMEIKPQVSEAVIRDVKDATGAAVTVPDEITNELSTNVLVRDGQTIVLGGLFRENTVSSRRQVPGLGDLPIIGYAFRGNEDRTERTEIIFLITPTVVNDTAMAEAGKRGTEFAENARAGARAGTLFFSRDKLTSQLNVEAEKLAAEGKTEAALQKIDRSLRLNPMQPEVIGLRQKLTGQKAEWPTRSVLNRIVANEAGRANTTARTADASTTGTPDGNVAGASDVTPAWVGETDEPTTPATAAVQDAEPMAPEASADAAGTSGAMSAGEAHDAGTDGSVAPADHAATTFSDATGENGAIGTTDTHPEAPTAALSDLAHPASSSGTATEPTVETAPSATATAQADGWTASKPMDTAFTTNVDVAAVTPPFNPGSEPISFAQMWFGSRGFFGPLWGRTARTPETTPAPAVTHVPEGADQPGH